MTPENRFDELTAEAVESLIPDERQVRAVETTRTIDFRFVGQSFDEEIEMAAGVRLTASRRRYLSTIITIRGGENNRRCCRHTTTD
jgi:hypothetical protein